MHKHNGTFETEGGTHSKKERHKVFTLPQNSKKKDTNKPAQSSTRVTLPPCFYFLAPHPFFFLSQPVHGESCDKGPPRNVIICVIERILKFVFGEELARWPESSLSGKVAQGSCLLAVDSAGETEGVVNKCTGEEKKEGNGVEGMFNNDMTDDGNVFEKTRNNSQYRVGG